MAVAASEIDNGYEQRSDGLWVHKGKLDAGGLRATNNIPARSGAGSGAGVEVLYDRPSQTGWIQAYDREAGAYRNLRIDAANVALAANGGTASLPAGTAQKRIGGYSAASESATATTAAWINTSIATGMVACTGVECRIEVNTMARHSLVDGGVLIGVMLDSAVWLDSQMAFFATAANRPSPIAFVAYGTPSAASHNFSVCFYNVSSGTATIGHTWMYSHIFVTEQRA